MPTRRVENGDEPEQSADGIADYMVLISILLAGIVIVALASYWQNNIEHDSQHTAFAVVADETLKELGVALVIGALIGGAVDLRAQRREEKRHARRRKELADDVFRSFFGYGVDKRIVEELEKTIGAASVVYDDLILSYDFRRSASNLDLLVVAVRIQADIRNLANDDVTVPLEHGFTNVHAHNVAALNECKDTFTRYSCRCFLEDGQPDTTKPAVNEEHPHVTVDRRRNWRVLKRSITLAPQGHATVEIQHETLALMSDFESWTTTFPATSLSVKAQYSEAPNLDVHIQANHRIQPELVKYETGAIGHFQHWELLHGVLPYQGVMLTWLPVSPDTGSGAEAANSTQT